MENLECIKYHGKYISFHEALKMKNIVAYIYIDCALESERFKKLIATFDAEFFTDEQFFSSDLKEFELAIKNNFNCLLGNQNIIAFSKERKPIFEIPYVFMQNEDLGKILSSAKTVKDKNKMQTLEYLILYLITKDLVFLNNVIDICPYIGIESLSLVKKFIMDNENFTKLHMESLLREIGVTKKDSNIISYNNENLSPQKIADLICELNTVRKSSLDYRKIFESTNQIEYLKKLHVKTTLRHDPKRKNICLIHLESISNLIFENSLNFMPNIKQLMDKSIKFNNHYTSATSTLMVLSSIMHGNDFEADKFDSYENMYIKDSYNENLFKTFNKLGYLTKAFWHSSPNVENVIDLFNIWNDGSTKFDLSPNYNIFIEDIRMFIDNNKQINFAIFINNEITHCGITDEQTRDCLSFEEKCKLSYISIDNTVKNTVEALKNSGVYDDTIIVMYGDHGDDKWTRAMNSGFSHTVAPHTSAIKTPLSIFDARFESFEINDIVSSIDLRSTMLQQLNIVNEDTFAFSGIDVFAEKNKYIFSGSLFANQNQLEYICNKKIIKLNNFYNFEIKNKSYCVINDSFCLVVGDCGMEFYNITSDYLCYNNLLNFFKFEDDKLIAFNNYGAWRGHFRTEIMADEQIFEIIRNFIELRDVLKNRIEQKNELINGALQHSFNFKSFSKVKDREFIYNNYVWGD